MTIWILIAIGVLAAWCAVLSWRPMRNRVGRREDRRREYVEDIVNGMRDLEELNEKSPIGLLSLTRPLLDESPDDAAEGLGSGS